MTPRAVPLVLALLMLAACGRETSEVAQPREPDANAIGFYCRMALGEHKGPKGQILPRGWKDPLWFSSVRDALTYVETDLVSEREMAGFWVNDMGQGTWDKPAPGSWIDARTAWFVTGSSMMSGMGGDEAVPFKERTAAEAFAAEHGGRVVTYADARVSLSTTQPGSPDSGGGT